MEKEALQKLIMNANIAEALDNLRQTLRSGELQNMLILQTEKWNDLAGKINKRTISVEEEMRIKAQIVEALLQLIDLHFQDEIPKKEDDKKEPEVFEISDEIVVPEQFLFKSSRSKIKKRNRQEMSFILHLITSNRHIRITAPAGMLIGKLAKYAADELFPDMKNQHFTWRFEREAAEIPAEFDLATAHIRENEMVYLTAEYEHKAFLPEFTQSEKVEIIRSPGSGKIIIKNFDPSRCRKKMATQPTAFTQSLNEEFKRIEKEYPDSNKSLDKLQP